MTHKITLLETMQLTPNVRHYVFTRPDGYDFQPGQATDFALDMEGWREEQRPFTFTGDPDAGILSFVIKSYTDHDGVTKQLFGIEPGQTALIEDAWGAIEDKGPGTFLAGGAGITPFIAILKHRARTGELDGSHLIFANSTEDDVILRPYWEGLDGLETHFPISDPIRDTTRAQTVDADYLDATVTDWDGTFYVCGPPPFEEAVTDVLKARGVSDDRIVHEE